jgi:hypothetical protein
MLLSKSQIETTPAFMGAVLRLPFDQKFLIRKQVQTVCLFIDTASPQRHRFDLPVPGRIDGNAESSSSRLGTFVANTFVPAGNRGILLMCRAIILLVVVCFHSSFGIALDPTSDISQYGHSIWRVQDGYFGGTPTDITQTTDGYIWVRTYGGIFRFDGSRFVPWIAPPARNCPQPGLIRCWARGMAASGSEPKRVYSHRRRIIGRCVVKTDPDCNLSERSTDAISV